MESIRATLQTLQGSRIARQSSERQAMTLDRAGFLPVTVQLLFI